MKSKNKCFSNKLRCLRRMRGLSQKDVAKVLGLKSTSMISRWEKGICLPETLNALKLAVLYRSAVDVIYTDLRESLIDELLIRETLLIKRKED